MSGSFAPVRWRAPPSSCGAGISVGRNSGLCVPVASVIAVSFFSFLTRLGRKETYVAHKFHERALRIGEIARGPQPFRAKPYHWAPLHENPKLFERFNPPPDGALPLEAQIAVAR